MWIEVGSTCRGGIDSHSLTSREPLATHLVYKGSANRRGAQIS